MINSLNAPYRVYILFNGQVSVETSWLCRAIAAIVGGTSAIASPLFRLASVSIIKYNFQIVS